MLSQQDIESELSYAYLHAVSSRAGFPCEYTTRLVDGAGVDAIIRNQYDWLEEDSLLSTFAIHIQMKATIQLPDAGNGGRVWVLGVQLSRTKSSRSRRPLKLVMFGCSN